MPLAIYIAKEIYFLCRNLFIKCKDKLYANLPTY